MDEKIIKVSVVNNYNLLIFEDCFQTICDLFARNCEQRALALLEGKMAEITLVLCDDKEIFYYNEAGRKVSKATDVLSFVYFAKNYDELNRHCSTFLGDILISVERAKDQSQKNNISLDLELKKLFIHGLLHIFGYDHNNDEEELVMENESKKMLEIIKREKVVCVDF